MGALSMDTEQFLTVADLARILRCSKCEIYRFVRRGQLQAHKLGNRYIFAPPDVQSFLSSIRLLKGEKTGAPPPP